MKLFVFIEIDIKTEFKEVSERQFLDWLRTGCSVLLDGHFTLLTDEDYKTLRDKLDERL